LSNSKSSEKSSGNAGQNPASPLDFSGFSRYNLPVRKNPIQKGGIAMSQLKIIAVTTACSAPPAGIR
jgi:hypothetical protein